MNGTDSLLCFTPYFVSFLGPSRGVCVVFFGVHVSGGSFAVARRDLAVALDAESNKGGGIYFFH